MEGYRENHTGLWRIPLEEIEDRVIFNTIKIDSNHYNIKTIASEGTTEEAVK